MKGNQHLELQMSWRETYLVVAIVQVCIFAAMLLLSSCGNISCGLLGNDSLRDECENGVMVKVYSVPTWMPQQTLRELWQADKAAQHGGLY